MLLDSAWLTDPQLCTQIRRFKMTHFCPDPPYDENRSWWEWVLLGIVMLCTGFWYPVIIGACLGIFLVYCKISELIDKLCLKLFNRNSSDIFLYVWLCGFGLPVLIWNVYYIFDCFDCYIDLGPFRLIRDYW